MANLNPVDNFSEYIYIYICIYIYLYICCITIMISMKTLQIHIQIQADSIVSDTKGFINFWLRSFDTEKKTQFLKVYANHTMPIPPHAVYLVVFKISIHVCWSRSKKINPTPQLQKTQLHFQNLKFSGPSLLGMLSSKLKPISCLEVYYDVWWLSYPFRVSVRLHHLTVHLDEETWAVQSFTKLKN